VVVLDKRDVASGSSAATTGLLLCETDTSLLELADRRGERAAARAYHLGLEAISRIESLTVSLSDSCGFARRPSLTLRRMTSTHVRWCANRHCGASTG